MSIFTETVKCIWTGHHQYNYCHIYGLLHIVLMCVKTFTFYLNKDEKMSGILLVF